MPSNDTGRASGKRPRRGALLAVAWVVGIAAHAAAPAWIGFVVVPILLGLVGAAAAQAVQPRRRRLAYWCTFAVFGTLETALVLPRLTVWEIFGARDVALVCGVGFALAGTTFYLLSKVVIPG